MTGEKSPGDARERSRSQEEGASPRDPDARLTEAPNPRTEAIDRAGSREIVRLIQAEDRAVLPAVAAEADRLAALVDEVAGRLREGGRLLYVGAGTSGRLGVLDAAECPPTFGTDPELVRGIIAGGPEAVFRSREGAEDDRGAGRRAIRDAEVGERDFVLGIATSGTTPFARAAVEEARRRGAGTGFLSCTPPPGDVREMVDHLLTPLVGPEVVAGSTRMKAGTATKLLLNTLSTGVMIRLGKVYGNLMVDLQAVSRKLVERSVRIVRRVCGLDPPAARRAVASAGGSVKTAIAMVELRTDRAMGERLLDACDGFLGRVLERFRGEERLPYYACYPEEFDADDEERLVGRLRSGPDAVARALAERRRREAEADPWAARGFPSGWSPRQLVAHLLEVETEVFRPRLRRVLEDGPGEVPTFPDWQPGDPAVRGRDGEELTELFRRERAETLRLLGAMEPDAWERRLEVGGEALFLHQLFRGAAQHDRAHADRIAGWVHPDLLADETGGAPSEPAAEEG